jgi:dihydroneopterin aldolase
VNANPERGTREKSEIPPPEWRRNQARKMRVKLVEKLLKNICTFVSSRFRKSLYIKEIEKSRHPQIKLYQTP